MQQNTIRNISRFVFILLFYFLLSFCEWHIWFFDWHVYTRLAFLYLIYLSITVDIPTNEV